MPLAAPAIGNEPGGRLPEQGIGVESPTRRVAPKYQFPRIAALRYWGCKRIPIQLEGAADGSMNA
ncbi:MAG: hypothetical protein B6D68_00795 [spirochete symbiont of Stewartia floridana]|nr:MAG: hypothetical protein B6D68_00795 [spirochete symbiont of Stewartia floridana]